MKEIKTKHFWQGRKGYKIEAVVVHITEGSYLATAYHFEDPRSEVSAHEVQDESGKWHYVVSSEDSAWHAGKVVRPTWKGLKPGVNPNLYCVTPDTKILMNDLFWKDAGDLLIGDEIVGFDEEPRELENRKNGMRYLKPAKVTALATKIAPVYEIKLSDGTILKSTDEHRWLYHKVGGGSQWVRTDNLEKLMNHSQRKNELCFARYFPQQYEKDNSFEGGFLSAAFDGEGNIGFTKGEGMQLCFSQKENHMLNRVRECLDKFRFKYGENYNKHSDTKSLYLIGGKSEVFRFLMLFQPPRLIEKWKKNIFEKQRQSLWPMNFTPVKSVKLLGEMKIIAFSSSSKTYIAEGYGSHNTYGMEAVVRKRSLFVLPRWKQWILWAKRVKMRCDQFGLGYDKIIDHNTIHGGKKCPGWWFNAFYARLLIRLVLK